MYIITLFIIINISVWNVSSTCYNYDKGEKYPLINNSYCQPILKWPVSDQVLSNSTSNNQYALSNYQSLYKNYYLNGYVNGDCLGVAKYFFCAQAYPTCIADNTQYQGGVCQWICQLFSIRCGNQNQFYKKYCNNPLSTHCSYSINMSVCFLCWLLILFIIL